MVSVWAIEQVYSVDNASLTLVSCWDPTTVVLAPNWYAFLVTSVRPRWHCLLVAVLMFLKLSVSVGTMAMDYCSTLIW